MPTERSYSLLTPPDPNLLCPICHSVLKSPWMSVVCEHFYCRECILRSLESSALCPCDRQPLSEPQLVPAPRLVQLIVDELKVQCDDKRCTWRGQRSQWEKHPCAAALLGEEGRTEGKGASSIAKGSKAIPCKWSGCTAEFRRKTDILKHEESDCPFRMSGCNQCGESVSVGEVEQHRSRCPSAPISCPDCSLQGLYRSTLPLHQNISCPEALVSCPFARFGCTWSARRHALVDHLGLECVFEPIKTYLLRTEEQLALLTAENASLRADLTDSQAMQRRFETRLERTEARLGTGDGQPEDETVSMTESLVTLSARIEALTASSAQAKRLNDDKTHSHREEINALQMGLHELKGEMMALQQMQYYESYSRYMRLQQNGDGQGEGVPGANGGKAGISDTDKSKSFPGAGTALSQPSAPPPPTSSYFPFLPSSIGTPSAFPPPSPNSTFGPYPPNPYIHGYAPMYGPHPSMPFYGSRRGFGPWTPGFHGHAGGGGTSPEIGGTKL